MPRPLHTALVAGLTLSLFMDAAQACWQRRSPYDPRVVAVVSCVLPVEVVWVHAGSPGGGAAGTCEEPSWCDVGVGMSESNADCCLGCAAPVFVGVEPCCQEDAEGEVGEAAAQVPVVVAAPTPAEPALETAAPRDDAAPSVIAPAPSIESVQPAAAELLAPHPAPDPAPAAADQVPTTAPEPNIFEEVDGIRPVSPGDVIPDADGSLDERPAPDQPLDPPVTEPDDPFSGAVPEPAARRRWIDRSGAFAVVATLVAVRDDGTCVLDAAGRRIEVPIAALSVHDLDYLTRSAGALAAAVPDPRDTAGR